MSECICRGTQVYINPQGVLEGCMYCSSKHIIPDNVYLHTEREIRYKNIDYVDKDKRNAELKEKIADLKIALEQLPKTSAKMMFDWLAEVHVNSDTDTSFMWECVIDALMEADEPTYRKWKDISELEAKVKALEEFIGRCSDGFEGVGDDTFSVDDIDWLDKKLRNNLSSKIHRNTEQ